jgi:hypothetical protein
MEKNKAGILVTEIDTEEAFYDSTRAWRERAIEGKYHSGQAVADPRSDNRTDL